MKYLVITTEEQPGSVPARLLEDAGAYLRRNGRTALRRGNDLWVELPNETWMIELAVVWLWDKVKTCQWPHKRKTFGFRLSDGPIPRQAWSKRHAIVEPTHHFGFEEMKENK